MEYLVLLAVLGAFLFVDLAWINRSHDIEQQNRPIKAMIWTGVCAASAIAFGMALIPA